MRGIRRWRDEAGEALTAAGRIVVLGVGNAEKGDDGAGNAAAAALERRLSKADRKRVCVLDGGPAPENMTGTIRAFAPDLVLILDAAVGGFRPGTVHLVDPAKIADEGVTTHQISLRWLVRYIEESIGSRVIVLGIEPKTIDFNADISPAVKKAVSTLVDFLVEKPT